MLRTKLDLAISFCCLRSCNICVRVRTKMQRLLWRGKQSGIQEIKMTAIAEHIIIQYSEDKNEPSPAEGLEILSNCS